MKNESRFSRVFDVLNITFMLLLCLVFLFPILYIISQSLSSPTAIITGRVIAWPVEFTTEAYKAIFKDQSIINALSFTVQLTVFGVFFSLLFTSLCAYPLSRNSFRGSGIIMRIIVFTMYFSGGVVPTYMVIRGMGMFDTLWSLIFPNVIDTFLLIIMINYFRGLPVELEEAAKVEGCSNFGTFWRVFLPLAVPVLATLVVFYAVSYWNTFFNALMYIQDQRKLTLQVKLYQVLNMFSDTLNDSSGGGALNVIPENLKGATTVVAVLPIVAIYPFMQRYFVKGVTVGAVKG